MTCTYIKKFSSDISQVKSREFEIDILGDAEKINEDDDFDVKYYSEDSCKVVKIIITKRKLKYLN